MSFHIEEVKTEQAFADIAHILWAGFHNPYNPTTKWFYPALATEAATLDAIRARLVADWKAQAPAVVHWVQAVEPSSGNVVGVAQWDVHEKADEPESEPQQPPIDPPWHVEGSEERRFAGIFLTRLRDAMEENLPRPHLELSQISVLPEYRKRGVGKALMAWGSQKGDVELGGLETVVAAVPFAVPFYERLGYGCVARLDPVDISMASSSSSQPSKQWEAFAAEDLRVFLMRRPGGGGLSHDYGAGEGEGESAR